MKKILLIPLWILSVLSIIVGLMSFTDSFLAGLFGTLFGISLCPLLWKVIDKKIKFKLPVKIILSILFLFLYGVAVPSPEPEIGTNGIVTDSQNIATENNQDISNSTQEADVKDLEVDIVPEPEPEPELEPKAEAKSEIEEAAEQTAVSPLEVHFIDVGQADCILLKSNSEYALIDAGNNGDSELIFSYLRELGVENLKVVIGTHPHEDHIGSLDTVINNFNIETLIMPNKVNTTKTFEDVVTAIEKKNLNVTAPKVGDTYNIGDASLTIIAPTKEYGDELNDWSVGIKLANGNNSFIMCGDAETEAENDICTNGIDISADVLKLNHHGSNTSSSETFLSKVNPQYAVITCGEGNDYGHPHQETLDKLKSKNISVYRTDEQGTIIATSDGENITWNTSPSTTMKPGIGKENSSSSSSSSSTQPEKSASAETLTQKVIDTPAKDETSISTTKNDTEIVQPDTESETNNAVEVHITNTGSKYHSAGCQYLKKSDIVTTLDKAKSSGLTPCSKCNPPR